MLDCRKHNLGGLYRPYGWDQVKRNKVIAVHLVEITENTKWKLNPDLFRSITNDWGIPEVDLFASRLNNQVPVYGIWISDPGAAFANVFVANWSQFNLSYAFPPFSVLARTCRKEGQREAGAS